MEEVQDVKTLKDYLSLARRRKFMIMSTALVLMLISFMVIMALPPMFESEATILIEQQHIPSELVQSTVTSYADERIRVIEQRIMTMAKISQIIEKYGLYASQREKLSMSELVEIFKENSRVELINADLVGQGRVNKATIAFKLIFTDKYPEQAQRVTNEIVTLFLDENVRARTQRAEDTTKFLEEEADKFKIEIQKIENAIAEYKQQYSHSLPELLPVNLTMLSRIENDLQMLNLQEKMLNERRISLGVQLAVTSPILTSAVPGSSITHSLDDLKALESNLLSKYYDEHPDILRVRRQIENFKNQDGNNFIEDPELQEARLSLAQLTNVYSEDHPNVRSLQRRIKELENNRPSSKEPDAFSQRANNPAYLQLKSEMDIAEIELQNIRSQRINLQQRLSTLEINLSQTHQVERGYYELMRDLDNHKQQYQDLRSKQLHAKLAQTLEEEQKGETFRLIEPPVVPNKPIKPNRFKLLIMGFGFSIGAGLGLAWLTEMLQGTVRGYRSLTLTTGIEPIIVIPYIKNQEDREKTRKHIIGFSAISIVVLIGFIIAMHFLYKPIDVVWLILLQRMGMV